ncbi:MBL fold metallo-hydrolase [Lactiplantibacillus nangangensis]|uniref:MBL fold metallo-hydrolase n=1 Tax=Lactiplantibacillus nangangensis TaxID=2559917 RepID=A0ABW1SG24_9LACO|nr:MBL fold metallo-hydrolase [Lactiplantibacillus nangangensis]
MKLQYLGTGAAERVPALFCHCPVCNYARQHGGKDLRTQTQAVIDDGQLLIDFPGDTYLHARAYGLDFSDFTNLLITHWHSDHLYAEDLALRMHGYGQNLPQTLNVYGNAFVERFYERAFKLEGRHDASRIVYHCEKNFSRFQVGRYQVWLLAAQHGHYRGDCSIYVIRDATGKTMLWTHDGAYFSEPMFQYLVAEKLHFDFVSLDCNNQAHAGEPGGPHMGWPDNQRLIARFAELGLGDAQTHYVVSHFSHNSGLNHAQMVALVQGSNVDVAYDGLTVEI